MSESPVPVAVRASVAPGFAQAELEKVKSDLNDDEVERAKNKIASSLVLQGEVPIGRMRSIGGQWMYNKEYRSLERDMFVLDPIAGGRAMITLGRGEPREKRRQAELLLLALRTGQLPSALTLAGEKVIGPSN